MALDLESDLDIFFNEDDFADSCTLPAVGENPPATIPVLYSTPDQESFGQMAISADAKALAKTSEIEDLEEEDVLTIKGINFSVKKIMAVDDGLLSEIYLSRDE